MIRQSFQSGLLYSTFFYIGYLIRPHALTRYCETQICESLNLGNFTKFRKFSLAFENALSKLKIFKKFLILGYFNVDYGCSILAPQSKIMVIIS